MVLVAYQKETIEVIRSQTSADLVGMHVPLPGRTAKASDMPVVLSTVGVGAVLDTPTRPSIPSELHSIEPIS
jgi:hypothetical protein